MNKKIELLDLRFTVLDYLHGVLKIIKIYFQGLSSETPRGSEFSGFEVWVFRVWCLSFWDTLQLISCYMWVSTCNCTKKLLYSAMIWKHWFIELSLLSWDLKLLSTLPPLSFFCTAVDLHWRLYDSILRLLRLGTVMFFQQCSILQLTVYTLYIISVHLKKIIFVHVTMYTVSVL